MLSSTSYIARRTRCVRVAVAPATTPSRPQQTRGYRFGRSWQDYIDVEIQRDGARQRHRTFRYNRYKYLEQLSRASQEAEGRCEKTQQDVDSTSSKTPDNLDGVRPGQNIEDAERAPMEDLLFGRYSQATWQSFPGVAKDDSCLTGSSNSRKPNTDATAEYVIDPITNRKVQKAHPSPIRAPTETSTDAPARSFKSYRSQFSSLKPPTTEDTLSSQLKAGDQVKLDTEQLDKTLAQLIPEAPPILESEHYVAQQNNPSMDDLLDTLKMEQKGVAWHPSGVISPGTSPLVSSTPGKPGQKYDDLQKYGPVMDTEPQTTGQTVAQQYQDLESYGAVMYREPDGKPAKQDHPSTNQDLDEYGAVRSHEPDGKYKSPAEPTTDSLELKKYKAFLSHEPDGKYAMANPKDDIDAADLARYSGPFLSHEPDGMYAESYAQRLENAAKLPTHKAFGSYEPNGSYAKDDATIVADGEQGKQLEEKPVDPSTVEEELSDLGNHEAFTYEDSETKLTNSLGDSSKASYDPAELKQYQPLMWNEPDGKPPARKTPVSSEKPAEKSHYRKMLEEVMARPDAELDAMDAAEAEARRKIQDRLAAQHAAREQKSAEPVSTQPPAPIKLETALDRHTHLQKEQPPAETPAAIRGASTLYKVLVYDPVMQCIDVAETTSSVADTAAPLTPAEVLLRISNPSKFMPHFQPLQAEGFEIVSGAGDVLIFRKVHPAAPRPVSDKGASKSPHGEAMTTPEPALSRPAVNPIDMTGGSRDYYIAADRFASPTGFVNYDLPPPYTSQSRRSDARREEAESSDQKSKKKQNAGKMSLPKRLLLGALWVGGISYSLSVAGEHLRAKGWDGKASKTRRPETRVV